MVPRGHKTALISMTQRMTDVPFRRGEAHRLPQSGADVMTGCGQVKAWDCRKLRCGNNIQAPPPALLPPEPISRFQEPFSRMAAMALTWLRA